MNTKREKIEKLIYKIMDTVDKTKENTKKYKEKFNTMSDDQFNNYMEKFLNDPKENFYVEILPFKSEPHINDIKKGLDILKIPADEYVYFRHMGNKEPVRTAQKVPVGYISIRRLQQVLSKKNSYSLDIDSRNSLTGQLTGDDKVARISDSETYSLTVMGAEFALQEFLSARSDNKEKKIQMYQDIATQGYVQLDTLRSDLEDSQTLNTVDVFFMGAGIMTDLVTPGMMLPRTIKEKKKRDMSHEKYEK